MAAPSYGNGYYPEPSQAVLILVLGILGVTGLFPCAPLAWFLGNRELAAIDAGQRDPSNRGLASAGRLLGMLVSSVAILALGTGLIFLLLLSRH